MHLGCILVLIGVLFTSSHAYIHHTTTIMRLNGIKVTWNEFWYYNMPKVGQNSLKKYAKSHSYAFKSQSIATSSVIWILTHLYSLDKYVNVHYMQLKSSETIYGQFKCANVVII